MMDKINTQYNKAVQLMKSAILQNQLEAAKAVNRQILALYYGVGKYVSDNTRKGVWGTGAIETISEQLRRELPGLRGFGVSNIKNMRQFYESWNVAVNRQPSAGDLQLTEKEILCIGINTLFVTTSRLTCSTTSRRCQAILPRPCRLHVML